MEIELTDGRMAVITDEDGIVCLVVREGEQRSLANLCHLAEDDPSIWERKSVVDNPQVREAFGLCPEVERRDLPLSSRPKNLPKPVGNEMAVWSMERLRDFLSK